MAIAYNATNIYINVGIAMVCLEVAANAPVLQTVTGPEAGEIATLNVDDSTGLQECVTSTNMNPEPSFAPGTFITGKDGLQYAILKPLADLANAAVTVYLLCRLVNEPFRGPILLVVSGGGTAAAKVAF